MNKNPCKNEELLSALLDGELSATHEAAVRRHLETCPLCQQRLEALQLTDESIQHMAQIEPSADFDRTFWRRIDEMEEEETRGARDFPRIFGRWPALATGLTAVCLAFFFIYIGLIGGDLTPEEVFIAQNMELLQDYDMIEHLDILEQWDVLENMKEST
jgi:anti-sigma factor RsiW